MTIALIAVVGSILVAILSVGIIRTAARLLPPMPRRRPTDDAEFHDPTKLYERFERQFADIRDPAERAKRAGAAAEAHIRSRTPRNI